MILNYNTFADTQDCISELLSEDAADRHILVLDNGSVKDEARQLREEFGDRVLVVDSPANLGFARGCNVGATILQRRVAPRSLLFLNSDATISWSDVRRLDGYLQANPQVAGVGPNIVYPNGLPQTAGGNIDYLRGEPRWHNTPCARTPYEVEVLHGSALLVRAEAWTNVGRFDPEYFLYSEETDWCVRATKLGWKLVCVPDCVARHKLLGGTGGELAPMHAYLWARNRILFMRKQARRSQYVAFWSYMAWYVTSGFLGLHSYHGLPYSLAVLRGVRDGLRYWFFAACPSSEWQELSQVERGLLGNI